MSSRPGQYGDQICEDMRRAWAASVAGALWHETNATQTSATRAARPQAGDSIGKPMRIKVTADVHGDLDSVLAEAETCDALIVLGDIINVVDYERSGGILAEVYGSEVVKEWASFRRQGRYDDSRNVLTTAAFGREDEVRQSFTSKIEEAHREFCEALPRNVILTYGNVDVPAYIRKYLPTDVAFYDAEVVTFDGQKFGFVGGGLPKVGIPGEVSLPEYAAKISRLGDVDVLCSHVPPALADLTYDTRAEFDEPGSTALLDYIAERQPEFAYFGHVHFPRLAETLVGRTRVVNVGHIFRSTKKAFVHG